MGHTAHATGNIVADGRTQTSVTTQGNVTDIHTSTIRGSNAYNSFTKFNVDQGHTANLHIPGQVGNLINLVHGEKSHIYGVVNSLTANGKIGGNVFFMNSHGIIIGQSGVMNVGSLTMITPSQAMMDQIISPGGVISDSITARVLTGQIPLSDTGLITVKGTINATGAVNLFGGKVVIAQTGKVNAGPNVVACKFC